MTRTKGAKDLRPRKKRSDVNKKRLIYAKKKTKPRRKVNGRYVPYVSKRKRDDPIHVGFYEVLPMSHEGFMNFSKKIRRKVWRYVYKNRLTFVLDPERINTKEKISELVLEYLWVGTWQLRLPGTSRNKRHCSFRTFATIIITNHPNGMTARVTPSFKRRSLRRLWWWRGK